MLNTVAETPTQVTSSKPLSKKDAAAAEERRRMTAWLDERVEKAKREPISEIVTLTPVLAGLLIDRNAGNRPLSQLNLNRITRDISGGRWEFNGEPIIISKDGKLNDGQHRALGVIESGKPIRVLMVFGPERATRMTLDTGLARTVGHFLGIEGYHDTNALAALVGMVWQWKNKTGLSTAGSEKPTKAESLETIERYRDIPESLLFVSRKGAVVVASKPLLGFAHWAIWKTVGRHLADEFLNKLLDGTELKRDDPILYCRNRLIEMRGSGRPGDKAELIFRAWNMHRRGERAIRITVTGRGLPELEE